MRTGYVVVAWLLLVGCGPAATHTPVGNRRYAIGVEGDGPENRGEVMALMHRHAARICPHGYDVISESSGQRTTAAVVNGVPIVGSRPDGALLVECRTAVASTATVEAETAPSEVPMAVPRWCALSDASELGFCEETAASCERQRQSFGRPVGACFSATSVHCFEQESLTIEGKRMQQCAPSTAACGRKREVSIRYPNGWAVATECREER